MPALKVFGRRWNIGSDDLVFPGLVEISIRGAWCTILLVIYLMKMDELQCDNAFKIRIFYIGTLGVLSVQIVLCAAMTTLSALGTMVDKSPRRHVSTVLYLRVAVFLPELAWVILGTFWTFEEGAGCKKILVRSGRGVVLVEWLIIATFIVSVIFVFDPLGRRHMRKRSMKDYNQVWQRRCRVLCCCIWGDENRKGAFEEIADMLTKFFKYKDIVLTDVIAGLVLLHMRAHHELAQSSRAHSDEESPPEIVNNDDNNEPTLLASGTRGASNTAEEPKDHQHSSPNLQKLKGWMTLENADYYCKYAVGSYGTYNYVMCRNCGQRCGLCSKYRCLCESKQFSSDRVEGDNICECQAASVLQYTSIHPDDILFANFENQIYETPFYVALDESRKSVVIAIRGTKTFQDAITDLTAYGESFKVDDHVEGYVHGGMLKVAENIQQQLQNLHILDKLPEGYKLIMTGHSLGAGAAVLLSMMLRERFPDLICFAFSPPGGLVSLNLQKYAEDFVCSVVLGNDIVPRLGLVSMDNLKYKILNAIKTSKLPKYKILTSGALAVCCGWRDIDEEFITDMTDSPSTDNLFDMNESSIRAMGIEDSVHGDPGRSDMTSSATRYPKNEIHSANNNAGGASDVTNVEQPRTHNHVSVTFSVNESEIETESVHGSQNNLRREKEVDEAKIRPTTYQQFHQSHLKWKKENENRRTGLMADPMYLPGYVLHLVEEDSSSHIKQKKYHSRWARTQEFSDIVVSPSMLHHHHGYVMRQVLQQMVKEKRYGSKRPEVTSLLREQPTVSFA